MNKKLESVPVVDVFEDLSDTEKKQADARAMIAVTILNERHRLNMTQQEFAKYVGVAQGMISKYENLKYNITVSTLIELFDKLGIDVDICFDSKSIFKSTKNKT